MTAEPGLLPRDIQRCLETRHFGRRLYYVPEVDSTNHVAKSLADWGERDGALVLADFQKAGRGRRNRRWISPRGRNLLFSLVIRPDKRSVEVLPLTLAFSLAIAELLSELLEHRVEVKWPNDVVVSEGKICGILAESSSRAGRVIYVIVGIGINVNMDASEVPPELLASSCYSVTGSEMDRRLLLAQTLKALEETYEGFLHDGFKPFVEGYVDRLTIMDKRVMVTRRSRRSTGKVVGVRDDGALMVRTLDNELVAVFDDEVTLR